MPIQLDAPLTDSLSAAQQQDLRGAGARLVPIGHSLEGRQLYGASIGAAELPLVSIVAGAHPDEPAGPLAALALLRNYQHSRLAGRVRLAVVPHLDPDGSAAQAAWLGSWQAAADLLRFLRHRRRRPLGEDREFAWPGAAWGGTVLPESAAADDFLQAAGTPIAHLSLHGMSVAQGPWFLLNRPAMSDPQLWQDLRASAAAADLPPHEFRRFGDKGFRRCGLGFCTAPSGPLVRRHFLQRGEHATAAGVGYGSMDAAVARCRRAGAPAPLIGISEWPMLVLPQSLAPGPGQAQELLQAVALHEDPLAASAELLCRPGVRLLPLAVQVKGMLRMVEAVAEAGLRRRTGRKTGSR